jgi:endonuclease/exonuclease/phosphatase family metal-dependent hydrolase
MFKSLIIATALSAAFLAGGCVPYSALQIQTPVASAEDSIEAMSFNIRLGVAKDGRNHWKLRKDLVFGVLRDHKPDVVGMQEAWTFQVDEIQKALPEYGLIGRSRQKEADVGEWCPVLYLKAKYEVLESGTFWLSDTPEKEGSMNWGNKIPRICTWARLKGKQSGRSFFVYNTHFDHKSQSSREKSAVLCAKRIAERKPAGEAAMFMGDLNAGEQNKAITTLGKSLVDTDYVYVTPGQWEIVNAKILHDHSTDGRYPSDHYPVSAELKLARRSADLPKK